MSEDWIKAYNISEDTRKALGDDIIFRLLEEGVAVNKTNETVVADENTQYAYKGDELFVYEYTRISDSETVRVPHTDVDTITDGCQLAEQLWKEVYFATAPNSWLEKVWGKVDEDISRTAAYARISELWGKDVADKLVESGLEFGMGYNGDEEYIFVARDRDTPVDDRFYVDFTCSKEDFLKAVFEQKNKTVTVELSAWVKDILEAHDVHIVEHLDTPRPRISVIAVGRELLDLRFDEFTEENIIRAMEADVDIAVKNSGLITNDDERRAYNHLYHALDEIRDVMANRGIGTKAAAVLNTNGIEIGAIDIGNDVATAKFKLPTLYGDDYCFEIIYSSDFVGAFKEFVKEFDRDKYIVDYIVANARNSVIPITVNEVIEDAQYIRDTLARAVKNLDKERNKQIER